MTTPRLIIQKYGFRLDIVQKTKFSLYIKVHHTTDLELPLDKWEKTESKKPYMIMNVDKDKPTFFKVRAYNREEKSPITPTFMYDDQRGKFSDLEQLCNSTS